MNSPVLVCIAMLTFTSYFQTVHTVKNQSAEPVSIAVWGLTHTHVHWIFGREQQGDIEIVGIVEPNRELAARYADQYGFSMDIVYNSFGDLLKVVKPEGVTAFGTIFQHLEVVEKCAPLGIHVMVEKPLAVSFDHALKMQDLAEKHNIHLLTNYETTWYPTTHKAFEILESDSVGNLVKVVIRDGHRGPKKIGINEEFLEWLTDPVRNGGGALTDFGCYGANIMTWLMHGEKPVSVTAVTQQLQPENNPDVDDEATIILTYKNANALLQPSWNWPIGRKDMEVYGSLGAIYADNGTDIRVRIAEGYDGYDEYSETLPQRPAPYNDPFAYFAAVIRNQITVETFDLSSLENNLIVMEILEAAKTSARENKAIFLGTH